MLHKAPVPGDKACQAERSRADDLTRIMYYLMKLNEHTQTTCIIQKENHNALLKEVEAGRT